MNLGDSEITRGQTLFFYRVSLSGNKNWKCGTVVDLDEHVKAVKLQIVLSVKTGREKREWFPLAMVFRSIPVEKEAS